MFKIGFNEDDESAQKWDIMQKVIKQIINFVKNGMNFILGFCKNNMEEMTDFEYTCCTQK